jgi:glucokinase
MRDFSIGVDLGGTNLRIAAVSIQGQLLEKVTLGTKVALGPDRVIHEMCEGIQRLSEKYKGTGELLGVGIGVLGIIDMQTGTVRKSANFPGWEDYPVRPEIERRLGKRVVLENDANFAALGEQWLGAARGVPNAAVITLGTGIGGGIVLDGKIWHGTNGMAGEFGHVTLEPGGPKCGCGNRGCAEQFASASAIVRMAREAIAGGEAPELAKAASSNAALGAESIYVLAMQGDENARRIFRSVGRYLGILLAGLVNVLNLDMFVIGGGVSSAWDAFAPTMFAELRERSLVYAATAPVDRLKDDAEEEKRPTPRTADSGERRTVITRALLGGDAGLYGAARAAVIAESY